MQTSLSHSKIKDLSQPLKDLQLLDFNKLEKLFHQLGHFLTTTWLKALKNLC